MTSPENLKVVQTQHDEWLRHPVTMLVLKWLDKEHGRQARLIEHESGNYDEFTSERLQRYAMRLATITTIKKVINDPTLLTS